MAASTEENREPKRLQARGGNSRAFMIIYKEDPMDRKMTSKEYELYKSAILAANDTKDKESLRQIQKQLIANYGLDNEDVRYLLKLFRYSV